MPRRLAGVSTLGSSLELCVSAAIVQQRTALTRFGTFDGGDEDRVVAGVGVLCDPALEVCQRGVEEDDATVTTVVGDAVEAIGRFVGESPRVRLLVRCENANTKSRMGQQ